MATTSGGGDRIEARRRSWLLDLERDLRPGSISPDGATLLFYAPFSGETHDDLGTLALDPDQEPELIVTDSNEPSPEFSPDGRFYVFTSNETGQYAVYAREVATGRMIPVSTNVREGGFGHWSPDGTEIFHVAYRRGPGDPCRAGDHGSLRRLRVD